MKSDGECKMRFNLKAVNGFVILTSEGYTTKAACNNGINSVKKNSQDDNRFVRLESKSKKHYFNLTAANGQTIGTSEMYESLSGMESGIESVKKNTPSAIIYDLT